MASQSLLHELLLALVGHTGNCIQPILQPISAETNVDEASSNPSQFEVTGLELVDESPFLSFLSGADRATINQLLQCGYHYTSILHFTQSVDAGATCDVFQPTQAASTQVATNASDLHRLDIQQQRSVYSAASQMLSPTRTKRPPVEPTNGNSSYGFPQSKFGALIPVPSLHPLLDENHSTTQKKAVGLYLRALVIGLDEILIGYRTLILKIEQEILSEYALNPDSATGGPNRITFGLTKLTLMLRQYALILPALHKMVKEIAQSANQAPSSPTSTEFASPSRSTHGCALLTFLHKLSQTGVPLLAQVYRRLLSHLDKVLMHQLINWTFYGLLLDPFEEFFIRQLVDQSSNGKEEKKDPNQFSLPGFDSLQFFQAHSSLSPNSPSTSFDWDLTFSLDMHLLPQSYFLTMGLPHQLLFLGKAVKILGQDERRREERERRLVNMKTRRGIRAVMELEEEEKTRLTKTRRTGSISHTPAPTRPHIPLLQECQPLLALFHALRTGSSGDGFLASLPQFEELIKEYHGIVSRRLYHSLLTDHGLLTHLDHLRRFILLGDGEFTTQFLELSADILSRPSNPRTEKELNSVNGPVRAALIAAGLNTDEDASYDEDDELQQIHNAPLQLLKFHIDSTLTTTAQSSAAPPTAPTTHHCWKQLAFTYQLSSPLNLIFISDSFTKYNELFRFQFTARRLQFLLKNLWQPMEKGCRKTYGGQDPNHKLNIQLLLLRQNMSFVLDTLCTYIQYDVIGTCWQVMINQIKKNQSFDSIRKAHEDYLNEVIRHCFLRDRAVSGALTDLFEVCLQFTTAYPLTSNAFFTRISSDYVRQSCFLFTVLTRKTDFTGGTSSFLHALVSRLDYNGYFTRMCSELGVNRQTKLVPTTKGTILSTQGIQRSLQDPTRAVTAANGNNNYGSYSTSHLRTTSAEPTSSSSLVPSSQPLARVPASTFRPSQDLSPKSIHLTSTAYFSQGASSGQSRPPATTYSQSTRPPTVSSITSQASYNQPSMTNKFNNEPTSY